MATESPRQIDSITAWRHDTNALSKLIERAQAGDTEVLPALREMLQEHGSIWKDYGDQARRTRETVIKTIAGDDLLMAETLRNYLADLRAQTLDVEASPLELLLVERICLCSLQLNVAERSYWRSTQSGCNHRQVEFYQRRLERAQNQYLKAIKTLAQVRKLGQPSVQINIAEQQINTVG